MKDDLLERLESKEGCFQLYCLSCVKGFENHEYNCSSGTHCLDRKEILLKTRKRLHKLNKEAALRIRGLLKIIEFIENERNEALDEIRRLKENSNVI